MDHRDEAARLLAQFHAAGLGRDPARYELIYHHPPASTFVECDAAQVLPPLRRLRGRKLTLYVHIPFATTRCSFCHYLCESLPKDDVVSAYIDALESELRMIDQLLEVSTSPIEAIHIGGGTPTVLPDAALDRLFGLLRSYSLTDRAGEVSIEASPETLSVARAKDLLRLGCTRLSIGVQSLEDQVLARTRRGHDSAQATQAIGDAVHAGFRNINVDLIFGMPDQTLAGWEATIRTVCQSGVTSVCPYQLRTAPNRLWQERPPTELDLLETALTAEDVLDSAGFQPVQANQWVRSSGTFHNYVRGKWIDQAVTVGIGASAYSSYPFGTFVNVRNVKEYIRTCTDHDRTRLPITLAGWMNADRRYAQAMVLGTRCQNHVINPDELRDRFGGSEPALLRYRNRLDRLVQNNLFERVDSGYRALRRSVHRADEISLLFYADEDARRLHEEDSGPYGAYLNWPPARRSSECVR